MLLHGIDMGGLCLALPLCGHGRARDLLPDLESLGHFLAILGGEDPMTSWLEVLGDKTICREETLRVTW